MIVESSGGMVVSIIVYGDVMIMKVMVCSSIGCRLVLNISGIMMRVRVVVIMFRE